MYLIGLLIWVALSGAIAYGIAALLSMKLKSRWWRIAIALVLFPMVFMAPLADEIVGKQQFDRLCEGAKEVKIYGTIPVGEELYTPEGKWRLELPDPDVRLGGVVDSYFRWDHGGNPPSVVGSVAIPIYSWDTKLYEKASGRLLAEWLVYSPSGGWLSRHFETPALVRSRCEPSGAEGWEVHKKTLAFHQSSGEIK